MLVPILLNGGFGYENLRFSIPVAVATQGRCWRYRRFGLYRLFVSEGLRSIPAA